ncbi:MAG: hypothetical protein WC414_03060 [Patescibacteria group bacterium]
MFEIAFIDFDETLFNRYDFKKKIADFFMSLGVTREDYEKSYLLSRNTYSPKINDYSFEEHIEFLQNFGYNFDCKNTLKELNKIFLKIKLADDADYFLNNMKKFSQKNILLSVGQKDFQMKKIRFTNVKKYFDKVQVLDGGKEVYLNKVLKKNKQYLFINDDIKENILIKNFFNNVVVISKTDLKKYSLEDYKKSQIPFFNTLTEIFEYVQTKYQ